MSFFVTVACGVASGVAGAGLFSKSGAANKREVSGGLSPTAFGLGRMFSDLLIVAWDASLFTALWMLLGASGHWYQWLAIYCGVCFSTSGVGYIAGALLPPASAAMIMTIACLTFAVFSGVEPPLKAVQDYPIVNWAWYLSIGSHAATAVYITFTGYWQGIRDLDIGASKFGFSIGDFNRSIGALFGLGFAFRILALLAIRKATTGRIVPPAVAGAIWRGGRQRTGGDAASPKNPPAA